MALTIYYKNIQKHLFLYADLVEQSNSLGLFDETVTAENLFCAFLNKAFGWKLINANELKNNQDSFDLIDQGKGLVIQITSNKNHSAKLNTTVTTFKRTNKNKKIKRLIVLFISKKCSAKVLKEVTSNGVVFEAYDIPKLLSKLYYENKVPADLKDLNRILEDAVSPVLINNGFQLIENQSNKDILPSQVITLRKDGLYINRKELIEDIFSFGQIGNGLLVGNPGVGKSFTIEELQRFCHKKGIPCFVIKINELLNGSDEEINKELKTDTNWIKVFKKIKINSTEFKAILIFDAFDTAKDEKLKLAILKQIKSAISDLKDKWNILVSARTYDASKSTRLLELFPHINIVKSVSCRFYEIVDLSEAELNLAVKTNKKLLSVVQKSTKELRILLQTPYFLKLLEKIVNDSINFKTKNVTGIETEEQLLEIFWNTKVADNTDKDVFLRKLTQLLASNENLSCPKGSIITALNSSVYDNLISLGVITDGSVRKENITFSHNILLDFAISKYLITDDPALLIEYVETNQKMPFLFRQSFIYFYGKLWNQDKALFWKHYFKVRTVNTPLFRLYHQTILNFTLGGLYRDIRELTPVFELTDVKERGNTIRKILEGVRFISKVTIRDRDISLYHSCSLYMHEAFIWELGFLLNKAITQLKEAPNIKNSALISKASLNYLRFVCEARKISPNKALIEINGGRWGILNACANFSSNIPGFTKLIKKVVQILKEEDFPIGLFYVLSDNLTTIFATDNRFAIAVYKVLYYHSETSDKETYLGSGIVLSLRSNRRQDFQSIHHKLEQDFKILIAKSPDIIIPLGIEIVNKFSIDKKRYRTIGKPVIFKIYGSKTKITADYEYYDSDRDKDYGPLSHLESIFSLIRTKLTEGKVPLAIRLVKLTAKHAEASTIWRKLIKLFTEYPGKLKKEAFELLLTHPILIFDETVYDAGELLKVLWPRLSVTQKKRIEMAILSIKFSSLVNEEPNLAEKRINRLLNCIPSNELNYAKSKDFVKLNERRENTPLLSPPAIMPYNETRDEKIARAGIDKSNDFEVTLYKTIERIETFNSKYDYNNKEKPKRNEFLILLDLVKGLFNIRKTYTFTNPKLKFNCDYEVSRYAKLISQYGDKLNKSIRSFILDIAFYYIKCDEYKTAYETGDLKNRHGAYSPSPRSAATQTFTQLLYSDKSKTLAPIILDLISDNTQIIRFKALHTFTYFWHYFKSEFWEKVNERSQFEKDGMCVFKVMESIHFDNIMKANQPEVERAAALLMNNLKGTNEDASHDVWHMYVVVVLKLLVKYNSNAASIIINSNLQVDGFARAVIFEIMAVIDPHSKDNNYVINPAKYQNLISLLQDIMANRFDSIKLKGIRDIAVKQDFEIIDTCIQHLYFTIETGKKNNKGKELSNHNKAAFFKQIKPLLNFIVDESAKIETGFMVAHTGYYFMQLLNNLFSIDPEGILTFSSSIVNSAAANGFTYDNSTLAEIVKLTEKILADHKELLAKKEHLNSLITILDLFANSGWQEALELTWRLKEVF